MQFEYQQFTNIKFMTERELNNLGEEGWELIAVSVKNEWVTQIFKRPKLEVLEK